MEFSLDENENIDVILSEGFKNDQINFNDLCLLAKYYYWNKGYKKNKIISLVIDFSKEWDKNFNEITDRKLINNAINVAIKINIKSTKEIVITKSELDSIEIINDFKYQKIAFIILFLSKIKHKGDNENYYLGRDFDAEIIKLSKVKISKKELQFLFRLFREYGLIKSIDPHKDNNFYQVIFANNNDEIVLTINSSDENLPIKLYVDYSGGEILYCSSCGKKILRTGRNHTLCDDCWKEKRRESNLKAIRKFRSSL